jgi:alpha-N-acetylglucosaminidase
LPDHFQEFDLDEELESPSGDVFRIGAQDGRIHVEGTSPAVVLTGVGWYLKYVARVDVSWPGSSLSQLPATLPLPASDIEVEANVPHRFALNDTDDGYSGPYRNWTDWEKTIDLLALHGYNEALVTVGQEAVYQATFADFGYSEAELAAWIPAPAHQPWWLMQNMCCVGAPLSPSRHRCQHRSAGTRCCGTLSAQRSRARFAPMSGRTSRKRASSDRSRQRE